MLVREFIRAFRKIRVEICSVGIIKTFVNVEAFDICKINSDL
jgi:hypothetical protein